jgi:hypothetical protein
MVLETKLELIQAELNQASDSQAQEQIRQEINQIQQTLTEIKKTSLTSTVNIDLLEEKEPGIKSQ